MQRPSVVGIATHGRVDPSFQLTYETELDMQSILLWLLGIPIPVIILIAVLT